IGQALSAAEIEQLKQADVVEMAYEKALNFLSYRPRSEAEIRRRLKKETLDEAQTEAVVERLRRAGLVDDTGFAEQWVENRATFKPKAKRALKAELRAKGVGTKEIESALAAVNDAEAAWQVALARAQRLKRQKLTRLDFKRKLSEFL